MPGFIEVTSTNMDWESALGPDSVLVEVICSAGGTGVMRPWSPSFPNWEEKPVE